MEITQSKRGLLLLAAGAKGAIGSTLAVAIAGLESQGGQVLPYLTTRGRFDLWETGQPVFFAGWDSLDLDLRQAVDRHGVLPASLMDAVTPRLEQCCRILPAPEAARMIDRIAQVKHDIDAFREAFPGTVPVLVNLLPASPELEKPDLTSRADLEQCDPAAFPDLAYVVGAVEAGIPVVNFTPNHIAVPWVIQQAESQRVPLCGRDGKTGQTYLKLVLASALKARNLYVDGWYSTNILGNADGKNLMDPQRATAKLAHKTKLLDELLGYRVGERHGAPTHQVRIDYYPPRGDAKEAWDVIDLLGLFDLPMSIRVNFQARDSILAAPMVLDLAQWMKVIQPLGRGGSIPELAFYFKKPEGSQPPITFEQQVMALDRLATACRQCA